MIPILVGMFIFGVVHSLLAGQAGKQFIRNQFGERAYHGFYRIGYNAVAAVSLLPIFVLIIRYPGNIVWQADGFLAALLTIIQLAAVVGLIISLLQIDLGQFLGLSQMQAYFDNQMLPLPTEPLQEGGMYALVRHPLYLFSLMAIWPFATMTEAVLAFNVAATLYFVFGSILEERRLIAIFGDQYVRYQRRVPWLIPFLRSR